MMENPIDDEQRKEKSIAKIEEKKKMSVYL